MQSPAAVPARVPGPGCQNAGEQLLTLLHRQVSILGVVERGLDVDLHVPIEKNHREIGAKEEIVTPEILIQKINKRIYIALCCELMCCELMCCELMRCVLLPKDAGLWVHFNRLYPCHRAG